MNAPSYRLLVFGLPAESDVAEVCARLPGIGPGCISLVADPDRPAQQIARVDLPLDPQRAGRLVEQLRRTRHRGQALAPWLLVLPRP